MNESLIFFFAAILIVGSLLFMVISLTKQAGHKQLNVNHYRSQWLAINQQLERDNTSSYYVVVLEADKLLDKALRERGFTGDTMGGRMKSAKDVWTNANAVWSAHKLRNRIAHEDTSVSYDEVRAALSGFKQALKDVGAI